MTINSNTLAEKFIQFLNRADAVRIDDGPLLASWTSGDITGEKDNILLSTSHVDDDYLVFTDDFSESAVKDAEIQSDGTWIIKNADDDKKTVKFLKMSIIQ